MSRSPNLGNSSFDSRSDYARSEEKTPSGLYPNGLTVIEFVNCIKFNSEKDVFAIALLLLRLERKQGRRMIKPESDRWVNQGRPEQKFRLSSSDRKLSSGDRYCYLPITLILIPTSEPSPLSRLGLERKPMRTAPSFADVGRKIVG